MHLFNPFSFLSSDQYIHSYNCPYDILAMIHDLWNDVIFLSVSTLCFIIFLSISSLTQELFSGK